VSAHLTFPISSDQTKTRIKSLLVGVELPPGLELFPFQGGLLLALGVLLLFKLLMLFMLLMFMLLLLSDKVRSSCFLRSCCGEWL